MSTANPITAAPADTLPYHLDQLEQFAGTTLGTTPWLPIEQQRIAAFADATEDRQWIHLDAERARTESPGGKTIAHGLLTLSLLPHFSYAVGLVPEGVAQSLNYGYDKVRFLSPVPAGARLRDTVQLLAAERKAANRVLATVRHTVEVEGADKPALVADALVLFIGGQVR